MTWGGGWWIIGVVVMAACMYSMARMMMGHGSGHGDHATYATPFRLVHPFPRARQPGVRIGACWRTGRVDQRLRHPVIENTRSQSSDAR